jgi:hypothetical protein
MLETPFSFAGFKFFIIRYLSTDSWVSDHSELNEIHITDRIPSLQTVMTYYFQINSW